MLKNLLAVIAIQWAVAAAAPFGVAADAPKHNVIIFVADGLRAGSVNPHDAPAMDALQHEGVRFINSHSLFPTVTTANASAIATGHALGDTGDFGNELYLGCAVPVAGHPDAASPFSFIEDDVVLGNLNNNPDLKGNYLGEVSLLACARAHGFQTAAIGKLGPVLIQDITRNNQQGRAPETTIIMDDKTGSDKGVPLNAGLAALLDNAGLGTNAPPRGANGESGGPETPGTSEANIRQQAFFAGALTRVVLPAFKINNRPFVIVYWSRDPDGTQHNQGDSLNALSPGINGPTSRAAVRNCDANLAQIQKTLRDLDLAANTDIFVTADHGFDTISKHEMDANGQITASDAAARFDYFDAAGRRKVPAGFLPPGFLAVDLAIHLKQPLYDLDRPLPNGGGGCQLLFDGANPNPVLQPLSDGNGLIGGTGRPPANTDDAANAQVAVAANGGADLIYIPGGPPATRDWLVAGIVRFLAARDYVSGIFVNDKYGSIPGALNFSQIGLMGTAKMPRPDIIVSFRSFTTDPRDPLQHGVIVADTDLQEGQGNHGGFDRAATLNFMAACGPDFKHHFTDPAPVSNADIAMTLAEILQLKIPSRGALAGRVIHEALAGKPDPDTRDIKRGRTESAPVNGVKTVLDWQEYAGHRYFDAAGFPNRTLGLLP